MVNKAANPIAYLSAKQPLQVFCTNLHQVTKVCPKQHHLTDGIYVNTKTTSKPRHHYMYVVAHDMPHMTTKPASRLHPVQEESKQQNTGQ